RRRLPKWWQANPFFIDQDSCANLGDGSVDQAAALYDAATDANYLAHAGIMATQQPTLPPFNAFFPEQDSALVIKNLQTIIDITEKSQNSTPTSYSTAKANATVKKTANGAQPSSSAVT
ncbi:MAG: hypothetical protein LQ349_007091, partial [Xanthoria aureola]